MIDDKWRIINCTCIGGIDPSAAGSITGTAPVECRDCLGNGIQWVRPSDHVFMYPGGPALGKQPGAYRKGYQPLTEQPQ